MTGTASAATPSATLAHAVRLVGTSLVVALMAALGVLQPTPPTSATDAGPSAPTPDLLAALNAAIDAQQAQGRTCRDAPGLTDAVLFQFAGADRITVMTFDEALRQTASRSGWVRGYCI